MTRIRILLLLSSVVLAGACSEVTAGPDPLAKAKRSITVPADSGGAVTQDTGGPPPIRPPVTCGEGEVWDTTSEVCKDGGGTVGGSGG